MKDFKLAFIVLVGIIALGVAAIFGVQSYQNKAFALEEKISSAEANIEIQEKARLDKVYNLADCVKQYDKHEAEVFLAIAEGRSSNGDIENVTTAISAVAEAYPELKSNAQYQTLMNELILIENSIAQYRENYTKQVEQYNRYVKSFPARTFLNFLGYEKQEYKHIDYGTSPDAPTNLFGE